MTDYEAPTPDEIEAYADQDAADVLAEAGYYEPDECPHTRAVQFGTGCGPDAMLCTQCGRPFANADEWFRAAEAAAVTA